MEIKKKAPKTILIVVLVLVFALAGGASYWYLDTNGFFGRTDKQTEANKNSGGDKTTTSNTTETPAGNNINDDNKGTEGPPVPVDENGNKIAQIKIVDASQYDDTFEVRAGVTNLTEENGTCEFTFTKGSQTLSRTTDAIFSGTSVNCATLDIPIVDFPAKGDWQMVVKYTSTTASGSSDSQKITIK